MNQELIKTLVVGALVVQAASAQDRRLVFSTYHGGDRNDDARAVVTDAAGNIYVTGETESRNLAHTVLGGKPLTAAVSKGYLTKYAPGGTAVVWRRFIGGSANTVPTALTLDPQGNVFVAGYTEARDLPMVNAIQDRHSSTLAIAFLMKVSPEGQLLFSTLFGGNRRDEPRGLAADSTGAIYMAGRATSTTFPVKDALQARIGGNDDGFIAKFTPDLKLAYATYLGGPGSDHIHSIATGPDDALYAVGESASAGLATGGAFQTTMQPYSSFAARVDSTGQTLQYFTYIGWRSGYTAARAIAVDAAGQAWIGGDTTARQIPTTENAIQRGWAGGQRDGFLLRLSASGDGANYISYLGGSFSGPMSLDETITALRVDHRGHVHAAGHTNSSDFPQHRTLQAAHRGSIDAFAVRLDAGARQIVYATTWGGRANDQAQAVALGPGEAVTVVGESFSPDLPVAAAAQPELASTNDAFVAQFCDPWPSAQQPARIRYVRGGPFPDSQEIEVGTGCPQAFEATVSAADQPWIQAAPGAVTVPMAIRLTIDPSGLEPGEYRATLTVTVPDAFHPVLTIPVVLEVADPPVE